MSIFRTSGLSGMLVAVATLAGCQAMAPQQQFSSRPMISQGQQMAQGGVEGEWASTDGSSFSRFSGGGFETVAADTGNRLAEGSYGIGDQNTVQISMTSLIRQTTTRVNCRLVSPTQLNCTGEGGNQFQLVRRS